MMRYRIVGGADTLIVPPAPGGAFEFEVTITPRAIGGTGGFTLGEAQALAAISAPDYGAVLATVADWLDRRPAAPVLGPDSEA